MNGSLFAAATDKDTLSAFLFHKELNSNYSHLDELKLACKKCTTDKEENVECVHNACTNADFFLQPTYVLLFLDKHVNSS